MLKLEGRLWVWKLVWKLEAGGWMLQGWLVNRLELGKSVMDDRRGVERGTSRGFGTRGRLKQAKKDCYWARTFMLLHAANTDVGAYCNTPLQ